MRKKYQQIAQLIREQIFSGAYAVGDRFLAEREIAEQYSVSRTIVREAFVMLELEGVVEVRKGSGIYILQTKLPDERPLSPELNANSIISDVGPFEILQARQLLESNLAGFAALQVTKSDIARLRTALETEKQHLENNATDYDGDKQFHLVIAEATQNSVLVDMFCELWDRRDHSPMWQQLHRRIDNQSYRRSWLTDHEAIFTAILRKNAVMARQAMWQHLENVKETLLLLSDTDELRNDMHFDGYLFNACPVIDLNNA